MCAPSPISTTRPIRPTLHKSVWYGRVVCEWWCVLVALVLLVVLVLLVLVLLLLLLWLWLLLLLLVVVVVVVVYIVGGDLVPGAPYGTHTATPDPTHKSMLVHGAMVARG